MTSTSHPIHSKQNKIKPKFEKKKFKTEKLTLGSLNVRTLKREDNRKTLKEALQSSKIDVLGLSEVRSEGEKLFHTSNNYRFFHVGNCLGTGGRVGFMIRPEF